MKRNLIEPIPVYRTVRVYSTDQATDTVSISIDEVPMRVSQETYLRLKRSAIRNSFYSARGEA